MILLKNQNPMVRYISTISREEKKEILDRFWKGFEMMLEENINLDEKNQTQRNEYHITVHDFLRKNANHRNDMSLLHEIECKIENMTLNYDINNMFHESPEMMALLTKNSPSAKDFLKNNNYLTTDDDQLISSFSQYTIEAIIVYVLAVIFNGVDSHVLTVRVATLLDRLNRTIKLYAENIWKAPSIKCDTVKSISLIKAEKKKKTLNYKIGSGLIEFLMEKKMIHLQTEANFSVSAIDYKSMKKEIQKRMIVICDFNLNHLPIKLNLPMVYPPVEWQAMVDNPSRLEHLTGGYLCRMSGETYNRCRLLTSRDVNNFHINLDKPDELCVILNKLQSQAFRINTVFLAFLLEYRHLLEKHGLFMKEFLVKANIKKGSDLLRKYYMDNQSEMENVCHLSELLIEFIKRVQKASYENIVLELARSYSSYDFYLPAFLDFRGRIYRSGVLHFHERDLSRSLIIFAKNPQYEKIEDEIDKMSYIVSNKEKYTEEEVNLALEGYSNKIVQLKNIKESIIENLERETSFKYKKFHSLNDASNWYKENVKKKSLNLDIEYLIILASKARDPFQFLSKVITLYYSSNSHINDEHNKAEQVLSLLPVTQDASASAYQIMSYLLLNQNLAVLTNMIPDPDPEKSQYIQDLYSSLLLELKRELKEKYNETHYQLIESKLTRKVVKSIFMPVLYGKKEYTTKNDLYKYYDSLLSLDTCKSLAKYCYEFWNKKFQDLKNLMDLLNQIGWFSSMMGRSVKYSIPYFTTVQDYKTYTTIIIPINEKMKKRKRHVTLRIPTTKNDKRKTKESTCVNFIHQKDAYIAMNMVKRFHIMDIPIYTVHDNFLTTANNTHLVPNLYTDCFTDLRSPLRFVNHFINMNLIFPKFPKYMDLYPNIENVLDTPSNIDVDKTHDLLLTDKVETFIHSVHFPIPTLHLQTILNKVKPESLSSADKKRWDMEAINAVQLYYKYVANVCKYDYDKDDIAKAGASHVHEVHAFKEQMKRWKSHNYNYSVHY